MISEGSEWREVLSGELNSNDFMELEFEINMVVI